MIVHKNKYFKIKLKKSYYSFEPNFREVIILPVINKKHFLLIKAKRVLMGGYNYEFPSGSCLSKKETVLKAAKREFEEETGIMLKKFNKFHKLKNIFQIPNRSGVPIYTYYVNLRKNQIKLNNYDKNELEGLKVISLKRLLNFIIEGKFNSSVPVAQLFQYLLKNKNDKHFR